MFWTGKENGKNVATMRKKWKDFTMWKYVARSASFFFELTIKYNYNSFFELICTLSSTGKKWKYFAKYKWKDFAKVEIRR